MSNYFGSPFDDNVHFPYLNNRNQEIYDRVAMKLDMFSLDSFKDGTLLYLYYANDRAGMRKSFVKALFKRKFRFHKQ